MTYTREQVEAIVISAGTTEHMLSPNGTRPSGYKTCVPESAKDFGDMIGQEPITMVTVRATQEQMTEYEMVEKWQAALSSYCKRHRMPYVARTVLYLRGRDPITGKRMNKISRLMENRILLGSRPTIYRWYGTGIDLLTLIANKNKLPMDK